MCGGRGGGWGGVGGGKHFLPAQAAGDPASAASEPAVAVSRRGTAWARGVLGIAVSTWGALPSLRRPQWVLGSAASEPGGRCLGHRGRGRGAFWEL